MMKQHSNNTSLYEPSSSNNNKGSSVVASPARRRVASSVTTDGATPNHFFDHYSTTSRPQQQQKVTVSSPKIPQAASSSYHHYPNSYNHHHQHPSERMYQSSPCNGRGGTTTTTTKTPAAMTVILNRVDLLDGAAAQQRNKQQQQVLDDDDLVPWTDDSVVISSPPTRNHPPVASYHFYGVSEDTYQQQVVEEQESSSNYGTVNIVRVPHIKHNKNYHSNYHHHHSEGVMMDNLTPNPNPAEVHDKYWAQRRRLFHQFDRGIQLDKEGWYSVTPEVIANHCAKRLSELAPPLLRARNFRQTLGLLQTHHNNTAGEGLVVLDAFCGCGGNAIAFAKLNLSLVKMVVCVDIDRNKLRMAAHNASIYGIPPSKLVFIECNTLYVMKMCYPNGTLAVHRHASMGPSALFERHRGYLIAGIELLPPTFDVVFMDPPWGGMDYNCVGKSGYDLHKHMKIRFDNHPTDEQQVVADGVDLLQMAASVTQSHLVIYDLPKNTNKTSLGKAALTAGYRGNIKLEEHYLNGRLKTVTAYLGSDFSSLLTSS